MRYFLDTEFIEGDGFVDIISIGVVCDDGRTFYAESSEVTTWGRASQWVLDNVRPHLTGGGYVMTKAEIAARLAAFVADGNPSYGAPEFWGYYADYDWVAVSSLFGSMLKLPDGWPMYCRDVKQWADALGVPRETLPPEPTPAHHALADAHWTRKAWQTLNDIAVGRALGDAGPSPFPAPMSADELDALLPVVMADTPQNSQAAADRISLAYRALMLDRDNVARERDEALKPGETTSPASFTQTMDSLVTEARAAADEITGLRRVSLKGPTMKDEPKPLCIYHGNCADGFTAAWAVHSRFGSTFDYHAGVYGAEPPDVTGRDVVLVDFSYKRPVLQQMRRAARSVLVLDHHKTAIDDLAAGDGFVDISGWTTDYGRIDPWQRHLGNVEQDGFEGAHNTIYTLFDLERSGAGIAWDFFHPGDVRPRLVDYAEDRDLWRFNLKGSREVSAFIFSHEYTFENWDNIYAMLEADLPGCIAAGESIERKHHKDVRELVNVCRREMAIGGSVVPVASLPYTLTSDAGHLMCEEYYSPAMAARVLPPFAACYWDTPAGRVFSLRSLESGFDVSLIAAAYGGGGHKNAAGFTIPYADLTPIGEPPARIVQQLQAA